jgi:hypothetical protein
MLTFSCCSCSFSAATSFLLTHHWKSMSIIQEMTDHSIRIAMFLPTIANKHQPEETSFMRSTYIYSSSQIRLFVQNLQIARCYRKAQCSRNDIFGAAYQLGKYTQQHLLNNLKAMRILVVGNGRRERKFIPIIKSIMKNGMYRVIKIVIRDLKVRPL